jgi:hypothetical protein
VLSIEELALDENEKLKDKSQSLPLRGCNVELTHVADPHGGTWWTIGFEAFGTMGTVQQDLEHTAKTLAERKPPSFEKTAVASYPAWLKSLYEHGSMPRVSPG